MSWERMYDRKEQAVCACGEGFVERNSYREGDDWNRFREGVENEEIRCDKCAEKYHIEHWIKRYNCMPWEGDGIIDTTYLVPNGKTLNVQTEPKRLPFECFVNFNEQAVALYSKEDLQAAIEDMKTNKFSTRLSLETSKELVSAYFKDKKSKKLANIIVALDLCTKNYDNFEWTYVKVKEFRKEEAKLLKENKKELEQTLSESYRLKFEIERA